MEKEFSGRVAVVTGAGIGIGYEICRSLVERGSLVVLNDLDLWLPKRLARLILSAELLSRFQETPVIHNL